MKKIALVGTTLALALAAGSAMAANSLNAGTMGLSVPIVSANAITNNNVSNPLISGKYFVSKDVAVLAGFGFVSGGPSGNSTTTFSLLGGVRKYIKADDFAPFVGGFMTYETTSSNPSSSGMSLAIEAGAEYFLAKQFSVEGKVNFGYQSVDQAGAKASYFGSSTATAGLNFYF